MTPRNRHEKNGLVWHTFDILAPYPELRHGYFERYGGQSGPRHDELNLAFVGGGEAVDEPGNVLANIDRAADALGLPAPAFVRQCHGDHVQPVSPMWRYAPRCQDDAVPADAMVALAPNISLLIKTADCQAVLLFDPQTKALALAHSGWRGSVRGIVAKTVAMMTCSGVPASRLLAAVSPSLGPCCAEFVNYRREFPESFQKFMVRPNYFDFWALTRQELIDAGLKPGNIEVAGVCTKCSPGYFSYRGGDEWQRGGLMAGVVL